MIADCRIEVDMENGRRQFVILNWVFKTGSLTLGQTTARDKGGKQKVISVKTHPERGFYYKSRLFRTEACLTF